MNILLIASEVVPFAKTGGLADVAGALPRALEALGHSVSVILPCYNQVRQGRIIQSTDWSVSIPVGRKQVTGDVYVAKLPDCDVPVYLIDQPDYFDREGLYGERGRDYQDNSERFLFFCRAALDLTRHLRHDIDVVHANDWQTGLVPVYLEELYRDGPLRRAGTLFTIHNMAFQGQFWHWDMLLTGLDWRLFNWRQLEFYGHLNMLKAGIVFADAINSVSKRYAQEIQTAEFGAGLDGVLQTRKKDLSGIINGIDYSVWNPDHDEHIAATYNEDTFVNGKPQCKAALQSEQQLPARSDVPLIGMVTRLDDQKGLDLLAAIAEELLSQTLQFVVLGTGHAKYHTLLEDLATRYPNKLAVQLKFDEATAHRIYAGADMMLIPSRYEPCGLNQLISMKYGTVPIVRTTGGLADTVIDCNPDSLARGTATGFAFEPYKADAMLGCIRRAIVLWPERDSWRQLMRNCMRQDWSWHRSAQEYVQLYERVRAKHVEGVNLAT